MFIKVLYINLFELTCQTCINRNILLPLVTFNPFNTIMTYNFHRIFFILWTIIIYSFSCIFHVLVQNHFLIQLDLAYAYFHINCHKYCSHWSSLVMILFMLHKDLQCYRAKNFIHKRLAFQKAKSLPFFLFFSPCDIHQISWIFF